jgi:hypothetical protein
MLPERKRSVEDVIADRLERNMAGFPPEFKARVLRVLWLRQLKRMGMTGCQGAGRVNQDAVAGSPGRPDVRIGQGRAAARIPPCRAGRPMTCSGHASSRAYRLHLRPSERSIGVRLAPSHADAPLRRRVTRRRDGEYSASPTAHRDPAAPHTRTVYARPTLADRGESDEG